MISKKEIELIIKDDVDSEFFIKYYSKVIKYKRIKSDWFPLIYFFFRMKRDDKRISTTQKSAESISGILHNDLEFWSQPELFMVKDIEVNGSFLKVDFIANLIENAYSFRLHWNHIIRIRDTSDRMIVTYKAGRGESVITFKIHG